MTYVIQYDPAAIDTDYTPRGGCAELVYSHDREVIAEGPAETGKTLAACWKLHLTASKYPRSQWSIVRKTQKSVYGSVLQTWQRVIDGAPVVPYGGEKPEKYTYANGAVVWIGGMDNPDKVLSSERDGVYVNQAEELTADDWEKITTRTTGRGSVVPFAQAFGDCNPGGSKHWIRDRARDGKLRLIRTQHQDNPTLYMEGGELTDQGRRTMEALDGLTGVRRKRLKEGIWATAEGAVYDIFDAAVHVREQDRARYRRYRLVMDEGYTNPAVILVIGEDGDGRRHVFAEYYRRGVLQGEVITQALAMGKEYGTRLAYVDEAAAGLIADLMNNRMDAHGAKGRVLDGIYAVQNALKVQGDGRPRLTVDPSCVNTINEFESYEWKPEKDEPKKENDHAMDAVRYDFAVDGPVELPKAQPTQASKWLADGDNVGWSKKY
jgi:phage terminase large subunit